MQVWQIILLTIASSLLFLFIATFLINGAIYVNISFRRRKGDKDFAKSEDPRAKKEEDRIWYFSNQIEEINLKSYDSLNLKGYFLNNHSNKLVILVHGYHGRYYSVASQARIFFENGFDVLSINNRTHDTSEGKLISMGKRESLDLDSWIDLMLQRNPNYQIVLYGISMGGHVVMKSGSKISVNEKVKCIIDDCGFNSLKNELIYMTKQSPALLPELIVSLADLYCRIFYRFGFTSTIEKCFKNLKKPILFFHGKKDDYVLPLNTEECFNAVPENVYKEKHIFEDSSHTKCVVNHKEEYREIVVNFVNKFIS